MLTLKYIRENTDDVISRLAVKHFDGSAVIAKIIELDDRRKAIQLQLDSNLRTKPNCKGNRQAVCRGQIDRGQCLKVKINRVEGKFQELSQELKDIEEEQTDYCFKSQPSTRIGTQGVSAGDNVVVRSGGTIPTCTRKHYRIGIWPQNKYYRF
jgi:seryl-tRNA synthetase